MSQRIAFITLFCFSATAMALSPTAQDNRIVIQTSVGERNQTLYEMREFLHGLFNLDNALAKNDMKAVAVAAQPMAGLIDRLPETMKTHLPDEFMQMGIGMNELLKVMVRDAQENGSVAHTQSQMGELMTYCSGCHDAFRFEVAR